MKWQTQHYIITQVNFINQLLLKKLRQFKFDRRSIFLKNLGIDQK